jgi:hypothetical protein
LDYLEISEFFVKKSPSLIWDGVGGIFTELPSMKDVLLE